MIVAKFGGTSMADAKQYRKVAEIVRADPERRVIVVSAPGKRFSGDNKVTDLLYTLYMHLQYGVPYDDIWNMISGRYAGIAEELGITGVKAELDALKAELSKQIDQNYLISRGEFFSAKLLSEYIG
ncbi:MAG: aspartate kinase, partial [Clostridia bacterium]|nr:aspartate kinase [Clostridia bacterium]